MLKNSFEYFILSNISLIVTIVRLLILISVMVVVAKWSIGLFFCALRGVSDMIILSFRNGLDQL